MGSGVRLPDCHGCTSRRRGIFCDLAGPAVGLLDRERKAAERPRRAILFREGSPSQGLFCINSGRVKVYRSGPSGKQYITRLAGPGEVVGLACLFTGKPCVSTAEVIEPGVICFVGRDTVFNLLREDSRTALRVMHALSSRLESSEEERVQLALATVRQRLARLLLLIARSHAGPEERTHGSDRVRLRLSRAELAELVGTAPETVMRLLREFRETRLLELEGREMTILNAARLLEIAEVSA